MQTCITVLFEHWLGQILKLVSVHIVYMSAGICTVWVCVYGYVCMGMCVWVCVYGYVCMGMCVWVCVYGYVCMGMCVWVCVHGYVCMGVCACVFVCMAVCVWVYGCLCVCKDSLDLCRDVSWCVCACVCYAMYTGNCACLPTGLCSLLHSSSHCGPTEWLGPVVRTSSRIADRTVQSVESCVVSVATTTLTVPPFL